MLSYNELKQSALKKYFEKLNDCQREAVFSVNGSVLVLAGAGSGKTTVIINRIANMVLFGNAYFDNSERECSADDLAFLEDFSAGNSDDVERLKNIVAVSPVKPWNILAVTFTNKAASELKSRLKTMLGKDNASYVHASTFHSACVRILRREIENIGYLSSFTIYDSDDSLRVIKSCISDFGIDEKMFPPKAVLNEISCAKEKVKSPAIYARESENDFRKNTISKIYREYQNRLEAANALDFDDIISLTVELFEDFPDILEKYQKYFKYIMVDEYQDTNNAQFRLVQMLAGKYNNICVVGDDDQSIYKFRGADVKNILGFEQQFENTKVIKLEQNYRSTQNILDAANSIIKNNSARTDKALWTDSDKGEKITVYNASDEQDEASFIANNILLSLKNGCKFSDNAILYRMNAQSNIIERTLTANGIPYSVFGGFRFYDRKEIKDIIAYLSVINNENDILRLKRIINEPKRGIGDVTVAAIENLAGKHKKSPLEIMRNAADYSDISKKTIALTSIARFFDMMAEKADKIPLCELLDLVVEKSGYGEYIRNMGEEGANRLENIKELKSSIIEYCNANGENASLSGFLEEIALYTDMDRADEDSDRVLMMTMHSAKGLEFTNVFIAGMEDGIFPSAKSFENDDDIEEERRLAYVAVTRARKKLFITHTSQRMIFGTTSRNLKSRFLREISPELIDSNGLSRVIRKASAAVPQKTVASIPLQKQLAKPVSAQKPAAKLNLKIGDRIKHTIFGEGDIIALTRMADDMLLEVNFSRAGNKKLMANCGKISKII